MWFLFIYAFTTSLAHIIMLHLWTNLMTAISRQPYIVIKRLNNRGLEHSELLKRNMLKMVSVSVCPSDRQVSVRCEDGALFYDGERFSRGSSVVLEVNDNSPAQSVEHKTLDRICCRFGFVCKNFSIEMVSLFSCVSLRVVITGISAGEVWFKRTDGTKTKIYISQLQKGKHAIRKA